MAYLALLWKARTIEKYRLNYEKEKNNSIVAANKNKELPKSTFYQKLTVYSNDSQKRFQQIYRNCFPEGTEVDKTPSCLGGNRDYVLKIVIGFVGGIALTYFWYKAFVLEFSIWTVFSWIIAVAITLGIVFSLRVRCLVLLLIPGLFSRVGRYTLACYALVLILTGPANNTLTNLDILSASLACGQEQINSSVKQIKESKENPLNLVLDTMSGTIESIQQLASKMKELMVKIHRLTLSIDSPYIVIMRSLINAHYPIAHVLQSSLSWLTSVETICNINLGTPFDRCTNLLAPGIKSCEEQFPEYSPTWDWSVVVRVLCSTGMLKPEDPICVVGDFAKGSIIATVKKKLNTFTSRIQSLLYVAVHIRRSHSYCTNGSVPVSQAATGLVTGLRNRADPLLTWVSWSCTLTGLFLLLIIFRAKYYQHMFRTRSRFDNRYVTSELRELDLKRKRQGRETVLPLNTRERAKYVSTASSRLLPSERIYLTRSLVFMVITTLKLMIHMVADYSLYWVLMNIRFHKSAPTNFQQSDRVTGIPVSGSGPLAAILRMLLQSLSVPLVRPASSTNSCLPDPNPPDLQRYAQIGTLILLLWLLALFEPYGLRLRHVITGHYQPERAKARAVWLYYHIIRTRSCFLKYARRKLHRQFKYTSEEKLTFKNWLSKYIPCQWLRRLLRVEPEEPHCLLCYTKHREYDPDRHLQRCDTEYCPGVYCTRCFTDIGQLCTICYSPEHYGDLSDVSLEKFNSDDSESDDSGDDDNRGVMKPLLETPDGEFERDENAQHTKLTRKNKYCRLLLPKDKNNQELYPLLECDYLNRAYNQQQKPDFKCGALYKQNPLTHSQLFTQRIESELEINYAHKNENTCNEECKTTWSLFYSDEILMVPRSRETEITVKGVTIPKNKLGALMKTMTLLTAKVNDEEYGKCKINNKHRSFEYLVMEMFQPLEVIKSITLIRHARCANKGPNFRIKEIDETVNKGIPFLYTNPILAQENISRQKDIDCKNVPNKINYKISKSVPRYLQNRTKNEQFIKNNGNIWSNKRNVKRYLEVKKMLTDNVIKRLRKRNIHCNKHKFSCRRRRRRNESNLYSNLIAKVSKVFSNNNKPIETEILDDLDVIENKHTNDTPLKIDKQQKCEDHNRNNKKKVMQEAEYYIKKNTDNNSNNATAGTVIKSVNGVTNRSPSKRNDKSSGVELEKKSDCRIMELEIRETTPRKLGFWTRLLSKREYSPHTVKDFAKEEPLSNGGFMNHKKRKKLPTHNKTKVLNTPCFQTSKVDDEARSYRISLYLKDREWFSKTEKYDNNNFNIGNNDTLVGRNPKTSRRLAKEMERQRKDELKNIKREEKLKRSNEKKYKKAERKAKPAKEKRIDKKKPGCGGGDEEKKIHNEIKPRRSPAMKILLSITQIPFKLSKHKGITFSEAGSKNKEVCGNTNEEKQLAATYAPFGCNTISPNDGTVRQEYTEILQNFEYQIKSDECRQSELTFNIEDEIRKCQNIVQKDSIPLKNIASCSHIWYVEPNKGDEKCNPDGKNDGRICQNYTEQNMLHTTRCFQVGIQSDIKKIDISPPLLKNSRETQVRSMYNTCFMKKAKEIIAKSRDDKEVTAYPELESRGSQCEAIWQKDKQTQVQLSHSGEHVATQCLPALQSSGVETEKTHTRACATQCRPIHRDQVLKEQTVDLFTPNVTIQYTDEKPLKINRTRIMDVATSNQSTTTETKTLADVSTATDWWSPILERKEVKRKHLDAVTIQTNLQEDKYRESTASVTSSATNTPQYPRFLPTESGDIMSASNYLFQTEYNQFYCVEHRSPIGFARRLQRYDELEKPSKLCNKLRKGPKTKRLDECYSPRKKMQSSSMNIVPPKWRPAEEQSYALKYYKRRSSKNLRQKSRKQEKIRNGSGIYKNNMF